MVTKLRFYREANVTGCRNTVPRYPSINAQQVEERPDVSNVSLVQCPNNFASQVSLPGPKLILY